MECRHGVLSMGHKLRGKLYFNGQPLNFTGGRGYIEMDSGRSFPSAYTWIQANDFKEDASIMAAVAQIPFCGGQFRGCICAVHYKGREYRLATYLGVKVLSCTEKQIILKQRKYRLKIRIYGGSSQRLRAPQNGVMSRTILETAACPADFELYRGPERVFALHSEHASFELEPVKFRQHK